MEFGIKEGKLGGMSRKIAALLPMGKVFDPVFEAIAACAAELRGTATRVDGDFAAEKGLGKVCAAIEQAEVVIADVSGRNPHVMYEIGYAHGIGKEVILISERREDAPFNRERHSFIVYSGKVDFLREELLQLLRGEKESSGGSGPREKFDEIFGEVLKEHGHKHRGEIEMENEKTFVLLNQEMELALVQDLARKARELGLRIKLM